MSQAQLADATGVTQATLSNYENGKRDVTVSTLVRLAEELDVALEDLTGSVPRADRGHSPRRVASGEASRAAARPREL
jgi:transcriptional regulator with XRE-family HTH domain